VNTRGLAFHPKVSLVTATGFPRAVHRGAASRGTCTPKSLPDPALAHRTRGGGGSCGWAFSALARCWGGAYSHGELWPDSTGRAAWGACWISKREAAALERGIREANIRIKRPGAWPPANNQRKTDWLDPSFFFLNRQTAESKFKKPMGHSQRQQEMPNRWLRGPSNPAWCWRRRLLLLSDQQPVSTSIRISPPPQKTRERGASCYGSGG